MKNLSDLMENVNPAMLVLGAFALVILIVVFFLLIKKIVLSQKEKKSQHAAVPIGIEYSESFFKVIKVNLEKGVVLLGYNPTKQYPFGSSKTWFKVDHIPKPLMQENFVIKVVGKPNRGVDFVTAPIF